MKLIKTMILILAASTSTQIFCPSRQTRLEAGLPGRPELPAGSYADNPGLKDCGLAIGQVVCTDSDGERVYFANPFNDCPQNGCYDLAKGVKSIDCVDTCRGNAIVKRGWVGRLFN